MKALRPEELKILDINASYLGVPAIKLMENAGIALAKHLRKEFKSASRVAVLAGRGNNGGDGFVAARYLTAEGIHVDIYLVDPEKGITSEIAKLNYQKVKELSLPIEEFRPKDYDVIIDAMLGVGLDGKAREPYSSVIKKINQSKTPILSVDVPSGWPKAPAIRPKVTITFHAPKDGMNKNNGGKIIVADIGIPEDAERYVGPGDFIYFPKPKSGSHKGANGRVLVIGGGPFTGAPALSGMGAMYTGADLAHIAVPAPAAIPVACYSPNIIVHPLSDKVISEEDLPEIRKLLKKVDSVIIGPGLGDESGVINAVHKILAECKLPTVIDAEALLAVKKSPKLVKGKMTVLTPHRGEFARLVGLKVSEDIGKRSDQVLGAAKKLGVTLLVKGPVDIISDGKNIRLNRTGNEALTVGGTGDVLAGITGCLLAKGMNPYNSAMLAAFINGVAGDLAFQEKSYGLLATDVAAKIPYVLRRYV